MSKLLVCLFVFEHLIAIALTDSYGVLASPPSNALIRQRRQAESFGFGKTMKLIEELISNLNKAGQQAKDAVTQFNQGLLEQAKNIREKITTDVKKLRERVSESISKIQDKLTTTGSNVGDCVASLRKKVDDILHDTQAQAISCVEARISDGTDLVKKFISLGESTQEIAKQASAEMKNCTNQNKANIIAAGTCLGALAVKTDVKAASILVQSGLAVGRMNLFMTTLPASLEACAGSSLAKAGVSTGKVLMQIAGCSTNSVLSNFGNTGNNIAGSASELASNAENAISSVASNVSAGNNAINSAVNNAISSLPSIPFVNSKA